MKGSEPLPVKIWPPLPESNGIPSEKGPGPPTLGWTSPKVGEEDRAQALFWVQHSTCSRL